MTTFIIRRALMLVPLCLGVTLVAFLVTNIIPGDPVLLLVGDQTAAQNPGVLEAYRHAWGFDQPLPIRYLTYLEHLAHGDLGTSILTGRPVLEDIKAFLPASAELTIFGITFAIIVGLPLGVLAALHRGGAADNVARLVALAGSSIPIFWLGLIAIQVFYVDLHIAPGIGRLEATLDPPRQITGMYTVDSILTGNWHTFWDALAHLWLPGVVLGANAMGLVARMIRESLLRTLNSDYVRTARSKGLSERRVIQDHALRNALAPTMTVLGILVARMLGGAVFTETIFAWPGLGRYAAVAAGSLDFSAVIGVTLLVALIFIMVNFFVDIGYGVLDPRVRYD